MILKPISIYIDVNGDAYDLESTTMYRFGDVNFIRLVTPMTTQLAISITFLLDTGVSIESTPMNVPTETETVEFPMGSGLFEEWNVWTYPVPNAVTATVAVFKASKLYTSFIQKEIVNEGEVDEYVRGNPFGMTELTVDPTIQAPDGDVGDATVADGLADDIATLNSITSKLAKENLAGVTFIVGTELIEVRILGGNYSMSINDFKDFVEQGITTQPTFNTRADSGVNDPNNAGNYGVRIIGSEDVRYDDIGSILPIPLTDSDVEVDNSLFEVGVIDGVFNGISSKLVLDARVLSNSATFYFEYWKRESNGDEILLATSAETEFFNTSFALIEVELLDASAFSINASLGEQLLVKFSARNTLGGQDTTVEVNSMGTPATSALFLQIPAQSGLLVKMDKIGSPLGGKFTESLGNGNIKESTIGIDDVLDKATYDADDNGVVDDSEKLNGQPANFYAQDSDVEKTANKGANGGYVGIDANGDTVTPRDHKVTRDLDVDNDANVDFDLTVGRDIDAVQNIKAGNDLEAGQDLKVIRNADIDGFIDVNGISTLNGLVTMNNGLVVFGSVDFRSGTITEVLTDQMTVKDDRVIINSEQTGTPNTALLGGIEVERGDLANYIFAFRELDDSFVIGKDGGTLQKVATREDLPTDLGFARWDEATKKFVTILNVALREDTPTDNGIAEWDAGTGKFLTVTDVARLGAVSDGKFVVWDNGTGKLITKTEILLSDIEPINVEDLNDVPAYAGNGGRHLTVNPTENGIVYLRPNNNSTTGIEDADTIVPSVNVDTTKYDVGAGVIKFVDESVSPPVTILIEYAGSTANVITGIASRDRTYLAINSLGNLVELGGFPSEEDYRTLVPFALAFHPDRVNITLVSPLGWIATQPSKNAIDVGGLFIPTNKTGNDYAPNGVNLNVDVSAGQMRCLGCNRVVSPTNPNISAQNGQSIEGVILIYRDGSGGVTFDDNAGAKYTVIDPNWIDNGTGTLGSVGGSPNQAVVHRFFRSPRTGTSYLLVGQNIYASLVDAIASRVAFTDSVDDIPTFIGEDLVFRSYFSVRTGAIDLSLNTDAEIFNTQGDTGTVAGGVATSLNDTQVSSTSIVGGLAPQVNQKGVNEYFEYKGIRIGGIVIPTNPINADFLYNTLFTLALDDLYVVRFGVSGSGSTARLTLNNGANYYNVVDENDSAFIGTDIDGTTGMYFWTGTTFKRYVDEALINLLSGKLSLTGGMMSGVLDMNFNAINDVPNPTAGGHATRKIYVDDEIALVAGAGRTKTVKQNEDAIVVNASDIGANVTNIGLNTTHRQVVTGNPHGVSKANVSLGSVNNYDIASQAEAEAGTSNVKYMTPLRTKEAIVDLVNPVIVLKQTLAMPTSGWSADGVVFRADVTITGLYVDAEDTANFSAILDTDGTTTKKDAWSAMGLYYVEPLTTTSIRLWATVANAVAFNFVLDIIKKSGGIA